MKKLLLVAIVCLAVSAEAQIRRMEVFTGNATSTRAWVKKATTGQKITYLEVSNESTTATDTLSFGFDKDTTAARTFPLRVYNSTGAVITLTSVYIDSVWVKSSGTVPYLIRVH